MAFSMRTSKPNSGNKYYITKSAGGWSNAIAGSPRDSECNVLANCVGYAYGRFNEIGGYGYCKYLAPVNAENFIQYKGSCSLSQTPSVGACMVWQKGASLSGSDGAGHVAIVERVDSATQVFTSESGYGSSKPFWNSTRSKGNGNWGAGSGYKFLGFIVNPAVSNDISTPITSSDVFYKVYAGGKWWSEIKNCNDSNSNGYAGVEGKAISGLYVKLSSGDIEYRVHTIGGKWLPWVRNYSDYAGMLTKNIDAIQMRLINSPNKRIQYRSSTISGGSSYLSWITEYNDTNSNGYSGIYGKPIDKVQCRIINV